MCWKSFQCFKSFDVEVSFETLPLDTCFSLQMCVITPFYQIRACHCLEKISSWLIETSFSFLFFTTTEKHKTFGHINHKCNDTITNVTLITKQKLLCGWSLHTLALLDVKNKTWFENKVFASRASELEETICS